MKKCVHCGTEYDYEERCPVCGSGTYDIGGEESVDAKQRKIDEKILGREAEEKKSRRAGFWFLAVVLVILALLGFYIAQNYSLPTLFKYGFDAARDAKMIEEANETRMAESMDKARDYMAGSNYEQALTELNKIDSGFSAYEEAQQLKAEAQVSYKGVILGMLETYVKDGRYKEALNLIKEAQKLVPNDADLQANQSNICTALSQNSANDARNFANAGQYDEAMESLTNAESSCGKSSELTALKTAYTTEYVNYVFDKADQTLETEGFDAAYVVVNSAYSILKDNSDYISRRKAFAENKPVLLVDLTPILGGLIEITSRNTDNYGEEHDNVLGTDYNDQTRTQSATYKLGGQYSRITGSFYKSWERREVSHNGNLYIYGDEQLLYSYKHMEVGAAPIQFDVDISGVDMLKIEIQIEGDAEKGTIGGFFGEGAYQIGEGLLYKAN